MSQSIQIKRANTHNLKNISVSIPKEKITVVVGVSGSGKSSLVFDTLAAESQRLLAETYSSYIQNLLPHYERPAIEQMTNLPISIVINQQKLSSNIRSTVGTITDIYTGLRLLFARIGQPFIGYSMTYSFNHPSSMCEQCQGTGMIHQINLDQLINWHCSLNEGAIQFPTFQPGGWRLTRYTESGNFDNHKKIAQYTSEELALLLYDKGSQPHKPTNSWHKTATYIGVIERIKKTFLEKNTQTYQADLKRIFDGKKCATCHGSRVNQKVRSVKINGFSIADCVRMPLTHLQSFLAKINDPHVMPIINDLQKRLLGLSTIGLDYLTIDRATGSLSGGESQRLKLMTHLNSPLTNVLYIFDEPSSGLHPADIKGIRHIFQQLKEKGNTIVIVDHDPDIIRIADHIIEVGPKAGKQGGNIIFTGSYPQLLQAQTITAKALTEQPTLNPQKPIIQNYYQLKHVSYFNIIDQSAKIPQNRLTAVTGVAGSGKSTLIRRIFTAQYPQSTIFDQTPLRGSQRSNLLTTLGLFDNIRQLFAQSSGQSASLFSFNGKGACPECKAQGMIKYDLAYLGENRQICERCHGTRYNQEALTYKWQGYLITDVLQLSVFKH